jgi:GDP-mannose 6-dehydrogenase
MRIYDKNVSVASLVGANRDFILNRIPHVSRLMVNKIEDVLDFAETIVIGNKDPEFLDTASKVRTGQTIVDFVRIAEQRSANGYDGICW